LRSCWRSGSSNSPSCGIVSAVIRVARHARKNIATSSRWWGGLGRTPKAAVFRRRGRG